MDWNIKKRGIKDRRVLEAMHQVPRHLFVGPLQAPFADRDAPLPIGYGQTISQPYIVAFMTEILRPAPQHTLLEVGTGSGYQAAVLSGLVSHIYSMEIVPELAQEAAERLSSMGYSNVTVKAGDGYAGWPEHAPFDGIIVTAGAKTVPTPLIEQLKPGSRLIIPIGAMGENQDLILVEKKPDGTVLRNSVMPVRFVPLTGQGG